MSDSNAPLEALADRVQRILLQAFLTLEIPCLDNASLHPPEFTGSTVGWRTIEGDFELVFHSKQLLLGSLQCSVSLKAIPHSLSSLVVYDEMEAQSALIDALKYLCAEIAQILPNLNLHLATRGLNVIDKKTLKEMQRELPNAKKLLDMSRESLTQMKEAVDHYRKEFEKQLRGDRDRRGGSVAKHDWTDQELETLAKKYDDLKPIWLEAKRIAKSAQKSNERSRRIGWRNEVLGVYPHLPIELLDRFSNPRADDAKPSNYGELRLRHRGPYRDPSGNRTSNADQAF
jgi:hypothetical protein